MKLPTPEFIESRVLPVVVAFGLGVAITLHVQDIREAALLDLADRAVLVASKFRAHCGEAYEAGQPVSAELLAVAEGVVVELEREARP